MSGAEDPPRVRRTLFSFGSNDDLRQFVVGCDHDIGGMSTARLELGATPGTARFTGMLSLDVRPDFKSKLLKSGYAGFRNKRRTTLFGEMTEDLTTYDYLVLRVRGGGDPRTRHGIYLNMQTAEAFHDELWQHKLDTMRNDGGWEDVYLPLNKFQLMTAGQPDQTQLVMDGRNVWMFGISVLGKYGIEGEFDLGIHSIDVEGDSQVDGMEWEKRRQGVRRTSHSKQLEGVESAKEPAEVDAAEDDDGDATATEQGKEEENEGDEITIRLESKP